MSWAEENGIDIGCSSDFHRTNHEELWRNGQHKTREGMRISLRDMETTHIKNTINYFKNLDVSPLELELMRRKELEKEEDN